MTMQCFAGRSILVVEDDFFAAEDLVVSLTAADAMIIRPVGTVAQGLDLVARTERLNGAVLDVNLDGKASFGIADTLQVRGIPVVFVSAYDRGAIPARDAPVPLCYEPSARGSASGRC